MKNNRLYILVILIAVLLGLSACNDSDNDRFSTAPATPPAGAEDDGGDVSGEEDAIVRALLLAAPKGDEQENQQVLAWAEKVQAAYPEVVVKVGFTGADDSDLPAVDSAAADIALGDPDKVMIFRVVTASLHDGASGDMNDEINAVRKTLREKKFRVIDVKGYGYGQNMIDLMSARIEHICNFGDQDVDGKDTLVADRSILNIVVREAKDRIPQATIDALQKKYGFKKITLLDYDVNLFDFDTWHSLHAVSGGGRNVVVPYVTTMPDKMEMQLRTMTWDGMLCTYDDEGMAFHENTLLQDPLSIGLLKVYLD